MSSVITDNAGRLFYTHPRFVIIEPTAQKVIFYNAHEPKMIEFYNEYDHLCMDILHTGANILCLCNPQWREKIGNVNIKVGLQATSLNLKEYYIRKVPCLDSDDFVYFRIEKVGQSLSTPYSCMMQIRAHFYTESYVRNTDAFPEYIPLAIRSFATDRARLMRTHFYGNEGRYETCVKSTPVSTHWNL